MKPPKVSKEALTASDRQALDHLVAQLRKLYSERLRQVILYGHKSRGERGSDLDILVVIEGITDRFVEMSRIHRITGPITVEEDILITAVPVDAAYLDQQREDSFFAAILQDGITL
ncbi:MAG TPA: nucleotidyltransferase domain-containing protein [Nitrospiria bacterium]|nr:nucleotidyltransferase domain-containing protein [Nitrospiria bacterium]